MRATVFLLAAILAAVNLAPAHAQWFPQNCPVPMLLQAPDAFGPGYYAANPYGQVYGPNYCLRAPTGPFNGMIFPRQAACFPGQNAQQGRGAAGFPSHPFARSPRDFFMVD